MSTDTAKKAFNITEVTAMLIAVARAAHDLAEGCCGDHTFCPKCCAEHDLEPNGEIITVDGNALQKLEATLEALDELPELGELVFGTGPAKAEAFMQRAIHSIPMPPSEETHQPKNSGEPIEP